MAIHHAFVGKATYERLASASDSASYILDRKVFSAIARNTNLEVNGWLLRLNDHGHKWFVDHLQPIDTIDVEGHRIVPVYGADQNVQIDITKCPDFGITHKGVLALAEIHLRQLAQVTGYDITFSLKVPSLRTKNRHHLNIVCDGSPPGERGRRHLATACGLPLVSQSRYLEVFTPTEGYGKIIYDADNQAIGQVVGNTAYLFIPLISVFECAGEEIFRRTFQVLWNTYMNDAPELHPTETTATEALGQWRFKAPTLYEERLVSLADKQRDLEQQLAALMQEMRFIRTCLTSAKAEAREAIRTSGDIDERLARNTKLVDIRVYANAIHALTTPIVCEHEGRFYALGQFWIRLNVIGVVSVWSNDSLHPLQVPHPHIRVDGVPCFGNVSRAIREAGTNWDAERVFTLILRWLSEGYDPSLADAPIEEWPQLTGEN